MQILLGALTHKSANSFAGAHCDVIFVGLLVMAWNEESLWDGLWVVLSNDLWVVLSLYCNKLFEI